MNEFISPNQNININISYNLGEKVSDGFIGKKIKKNLGAKVKEGDAIVGDLQSVFKKSKNKSTKLYKSKKFENWKDCEEPKDCQQKKKYHKKTGTAKKQKRSVIDTEFDISVDAAKKRFKTEMSVITDIQPKKYKKSTQHIKSSQHHSKSANLGVYYSKSKKESHLNNNHYLKNPFKKGESKCGFQNAKSIGKEENNWSKSGYLGTTKNFSKRKQRSQSAHAIKCDKFVTKLLDISVIASQLGGSVIMNDKNKDKNEQEEIKSFNKENNNSENLSEFMNSIDMRVLRTMEKDNNINHWKKSTQKLNRSVDISHGMQLITYLTKIKRISLKKLNACASTIQTFWKNKNKQMVVSYYTSLFRNINTNFYCLSNPTQIQSQNISEKQQSVFSHDNHELPGQFKYEQSDPNFGQIPKLSISDLNNFKEFSSSDSAEINEDQGHNYKEQQFQQNNRKKYVTNFMEVIESQRSSGSAKLIDSIKNGSNQNSEKSSRIKMKRKYGANIIRHLSQNGSQSSSFLSQQNSMHSDSLMGSDESGQEPEEKQRSFNINKYRQLVNNVLQKNKQSEKVGQYLSKNSDSISVSNAIFHQDSQIRESEPSNDKSGEFRKETSQKSVRWNQVHKMLSSNMNKNVPIIPKNILEELMKQSAYNKQWVDGQFSKDSNQSNNLNLILEQQQNQSQIKGEYDPANRKLQTINSSQRESLSQDQPPSISWNKCSQQPQNNMLIKKICESEESSLCDSKLVHEQLKIENDCGLDSFGLALHGTIHNNSYQSNEPEINQNQSIFSNDELQDEQEQKVFVFAEGGDLPSISPDPSQTDKILKQLKDTKKQNVTEMILVTLMEELSKDISRLLKNSQENRAAVVINENRPIRVRQAKPQQNAVQPQSPMVTNFQSIREFILKLKQFILSKPEYIDKVVKNIRNNIGPTSLQILSYLRIEPSESDADLNSEQGSQEDQWLFVIPNDLFEQFHLKLVEQKQRVYQKSLPRRIKLFLQFWHRGIFQCYNQCLDYERPFGITGPSYAWITEPKLQRKISNLKIQQILESAEGRLLELSCSGSGIIFDKFDSPYTQLSLNEESKNQLNQDRISRMLASDILDDEYNWVVYNDEITEILVEVSRKLEEQLILQMRKQSIQMKQQKNEYQQITEQCSSQQVENVRFDQLLE